LALDEVVNAYQDDSCSSKLTVVYQANIDDAVTAGGNTTTTPNGGADVSKFSGWTWTAINNKF